MAMLTLSGSYGSRNRRAMPSAENVARCVNVSIMDRAAFTAPFSYNQALSAFRTADYTAIRTGLSGISFTHFPERRAIRNRLVREHLSESGPSSIMDGFGHRGSCQCLGIHAPNGDEIKLSRDARREFVQKILSSISDFGMDALKTLGLFRTLGNGEFLLRSAIEFWSRNLFSSGQGGNIFKPKINADCLLRHARIDIRHLKCHIEKPSAARILRKTGAVNNFSIFWERPAKAQFVQASKIANTLFRDLKSRFSKRYPTQRFAASIAEVRLTSFTARPLEYGANLTNGVRRYSEKSARPRSLSDKIKARGPLLRVLEGMPLRIIAIVPDRINGAAHRIESANLRFHAVSVGQNHRRTLYGSGQI